jgi:hypothetical protein
MKKITQTNTHTVWVPGIVFKHWAQQYWTHIFKHWAQQYWTHVFKALSSAVWHKWKRLRKQTHTVWVPGIGIHCILYNIPRGVHTYVLANTQHRKLAFPTHYEDSTTRLMTFLNQPDIYGVASFVAECLALVPWSFLAPFFVWLQATSKLPFRCPPEAI